MDGRSDGLELSLKAVSANLPVRRQATTRRPWPQIFTTSESLGYQKIPLVGHDIGLMVAYSYAAQYPSEVEKLALLEAPIPGIGDIWQKVLYHTRALALSFRLQSDCARPGQRMRTHFF